MGSTQFGNFHNFCRDSTLPVCNLFSLSKNNNEYGGCPLTGISFNDGKQLGNLGSILVAGLAIALSMFLILQTSKWRASVGQKEMQIFLMGYILIEICEIFTVGLFPLNKDVRVAFTGIHLGAITATLWVLMLNAVVGFQLMDDGTWLSLALIGGSALALFLGTGYIALDTGYSWSGHFDSSLADNGNGQNRNVGLFVLYQLAPLLFLTIFFLMEAYLVIKVLGESRPLMYLGGAALLFAVGQIFNYVISVHICTGTQGDINGAFFQTLFTLLSVVAIWLFWASITEHDWTYPKTDNGKQ